MTIRTTQIRWPDLPPREPATQQVDPRAVGLHATMCAAGPMCPGRPSFFKFDVRAGQVLAWCDRHVPADAMMTAEERRKIRARGGQPEPHNPRYCSCVVCLAVMTNQVKG